MRAVDFVGEVTTGCNYEVSLLHVIRDKDHPFSKSLFKTFAKDRAEAVASANYLATKKLVSWGLPSDAITTRTIRGKSSRARTMFEEAKANAFGTIVVGRRGRSGVQDFFIGSVANKIIYLARDPAVWIIP
jgi:nucleotide-binding universal stress UspA family protein